MNIPLGEVFTSPLLAGTEGLLHVGNVYVEDYQFKNLRIRFAEGRVTDFSCENFKPDGDWMEQGRALVKQVILRGHDWLPLGEFAIGTNTAAYAMARTVWDRRQAANPDRGEDGAALCSGGYLLQLCGGFSHVQSRRQGGDRPGQ